VNALRALRVPVRWWRRRTLHARLALLVAGAVAVAVVAVAASAWVAVAEVLDRRLEERLETDARAVAAQPDRWRTAYPVPADDDPGGRDDGDGDDDRGDDGDDGDGDDDGPGDLGPRWQILDAGGAVVSEPAGLLPVTEDAREVAAGGRDRAEERVTLDGDTHRMLTVPATGGGAVQVAVDETENARALGSLGLLLAGGCVAGIAAAAGLGWAVARAGLVPVQRLTRDVEDVAATLDLTRPVAVSGADEVARLGRSVNTLLTAVEAARRAQRALVEDAGHELRTPLTSIRTNIELLLSVERRPDLAHRLPPADRAQLLRDLDAQVAELATLTTELVELAREETTREAAEPVGLADVVEAAVGRVRMRAPHVTFRTDLAPVTVTGRPAELERMVLNVLDNAAKWSPPDGTVGVRLAADGAGWCTVTVTDTGPGIADADRPHVFDRFHRAAGARHAGLRAGPRDRRADGGPARRRRHDRAERAARHGGRHPAPRAGRPGGPAGAVAGRLARCARAGILSGNNRHPTPGGRRHVGPALHPAADLAAVRRGTPRHRGAGPRGRPPTRASRRPHAGVARAAHRR
jgi:two-component system sensor histidine kinase MprB